MMITSKLWVRYILLCLLIGAGLVFPKKISTVLTVDRDDNPDFGTANCSISGVTPQIKLELTVDQLSSDAVEIMNEEIWTRPITNETIYYVLVAEYEITSCINTFILYCSPVPDENNIYIDSSSIIVETDGSYCQENGGSPALIVILILAIVVVIVIVAVFIYWKRSGINVVTELFSKARGGGSKIKSDVEDEENELKEPLTSEIPIKSETSKDIFMKQLCLFCEKLEKDEIKEKEFQTLLVDFYSAHKVDPIPLLEEFIKAENLENEVAIRLTIYFAKCERNEWILSSKVAKLINIVLEKQKLSFENRLKTFGDMYSKKQIITDEYIIVTLSLFTDKRNEFDKAIEDLKSSTTHVDDKFIDKLLECLDEFLNNDYEDLKPMSNPDDTDVEIIISPEPNSDVEESDLVKLLLSLSSSKNLHVVFLKLLILGVERGKIKTDICVNIVKECDEQLHREYHFIITSGGEKWISKNTFIDLLKCSRRIDIDTDSFFILQLSSLLLNEILSISEYLEELKSSLGEELISKECLAAQLDGCIKSAKLSKQSQMEIFRRALDEDWIAGEILQEKIGDEWGKEEWVKMLLPITIGREKENMKHVDLLINVIKKYQITTDDIKSIMHYAGIPEQQQAILLKNEKIFKKLDKHRKSRKDKK